MNPETAILAALALPPLIAVGIVLAGQVNQNLREAVTLIGAAALAWIVWGLLSTGFFIYVLVLITQVIRQGQSVMDGTARSLFGAILPLFYVSWWLYPVAYAAPGFMAVGASYEITC